MQDWDVFIAYASADEGQASELYDQLEARGHSVFFAPRSLNLGAIWQTEIPSALRQSRLIVVLVSPATENAFYLQEEIVRAVHLARSSDGKHRVVPVILDGASRNALPYGLQILQAIDAGKAGSGIAVRISDLARGLDAPEAPSMLEELSDPVGREELFDRLCRLLPAQLGEIAFRLNVEPYVNRQAPQSTQAVELVHLAEQSRGGVGRLMEMIRRVSPRS